MLKNPRRKNIYKLSKDSNKQGPKNGVKKTTVINSSIYIYIVYTCLVKRLGRTYNTPIKQEDLV